MTDRLDTLERRLEQLSRALDNLDIDDGDEVRETARTIAWAHEQRAASMARRRDLRGYVLVLATSITSTVLGALAMRYFGLSK